MIVIVQRVSEAKVIVDKKNNGSIKKGLLLLLGIHDNDTYDQIHWICKKILKLRIFPDEHGRMNKSVTDINGEILVVSQFTLYGDIKKGNRPSYIEAAEPKKAKPLYDYMINYLKINSDLNIQTGCFGAMMDVHLINDGPVTLIIEK